MGDTSSGNQDPRQSAGTAITRWAHRTVQPRALPLASSAVLAALVRAGTSHVYADTASPRELAQVAFLPGGERIAEIDGNTVNQPQLRKVLDDHLEPARLRLCAEDLADRPRTAPLASYLYTVLLARVGADMAGSFESGQPWEVSLQLPMSAAAHPAQAVELGAALRRMVPSALVSVPFRPQHPACFLAARNLERQLIPVNFTSTFSARQVVAAALLTHAHRTNVFVGRINKGLQAKLLGEHVCLEAQRALLRLRREVGARTRLIVAGVQDWSSFLRTAGCDAYTAPVGVLDAFLHEPDVVRHIRSQLHTSLAGEMTVAAEVAAVLGMQRMAGLWRVEPAFVEFLIAYRASGEYRSLEDPDQLVRRFDEAGFGDFFHMPTAAQRAELSAGKLPDLGSSLVRQLPLDTYYSLLADADFVREQEAIDQAIARCVGPGPA